MARYSMAEARDRIAAIFDQALKGEVVTITRDGLPVLELRTTETREARDAYERMIDEIGQHAACLPSLGQSPDAIIREMRDDYP